MKKLLPVLAFGIAAATALPADAARIAIGVGSRGAAVTVSSGHDYGRWGRRRAYMERGEIERRIYREGFVRVYDMDRYGDYYRARAVDRRGVVFLLTIDAYSGAIIRTEFATGGGRWRR